MAAESELPADLDVNQMAALLEKETVNATAGELAKTPETDPEHAAEAAEVGADGDGGAEPDTDVGEGEPGEEPSVPAVDAPEFWSAEDKAFWAKIPTEIQPLVKKYEEARVEFANQKAREAAAERQRAAEEVTKYKDTVVQAANWWQQNEPAFVKAFGDKWSQVNWAQLAEHNPAEGFRLRELQRQEAELLQQAHERGQRDMAERNRRAQESFEQTRVSEHAKVAQALPDHFGTTEKATKTYTDLGNYLVAQGIPAEQIQTIHQAAQIKIALKAMLYDAAKAKASTVTSSGTGRNPATPAPTRVAPGPAQKPGNRNGEAIRQARRQFVENNNDMDAAAAYLRAAGLA